MKKRDFYLPSSDGKSRLHCVEWMPEPVGRVANSPERADLPEGKPDPAVQKSRAEIKLWVQLVHGMNEHMGRYGEFAAFLAEHGIAVIGHDCLGHGSTAAYGATELSKEDRGFLQRKTAELFCCAICAGWPVMVQNAIRMQNTSCLATAWVRF
ncbi:MAG: alpha/beta hydrolase [Clostridium sp.]